MSKERQINALAKDPLRARNTANYLLSFRDVEWTDWELDFLESMAGRADELSYRQAEKLLELRDGAVRHTHASGIRLSAMLETLWRQREDLDSDDDRAFLERLKLRGETALRRRDALRLRYCAIALGEIEANQSWSMPYGVL